MSSKEHGVEVGGDPKTGHWGELVDTRAGCIAGTGLCRMQVSIKGIQVEGTWRLQAQWLVGTEGKGPQRTKMTRLGECLGVGVQGRGSGDTTAVQKTEGEDRKKGIGRDQREGIWGPQIGHERDPRDEMSEGTKTKR